MRHCEEDLQLPLSLNFLEQVLELSFTFCTIGDCLNLFLILNNIQIDETLESESLFFNIDCAINEIVDVIPM